MITVREATDDDLSALKPLLEQWIAECNPDQLKFEPEADRLLETFRGFRYLAIGTTLVAVDGATPVGCMGLIQHGWGASARENFVSESLWYMAPDYAGHAPTLIRAAKAWAKARGCDYFIMSTNRLSTARSEKAEALFEAIGFKPMYRLFITEA